MSSLLPDDALVYTPGGWAYEYCQSRNEWKVAQRRVDVPLEVPTPQPVVRIVFADLSVEKWQ